jgi:hypothetical protein
MLSLTFNGKVIFLIIDINNLRHHIIINTSGYAQFSNAIRRVCRMIHKMAVHFVPFSKYYLIRNSPVISRCKDCVRYSDLTCPRNRFWLTFTKEVPSCFFNKNTGRDF